MNYRILIHVIAIENGDFYRSLRKVPEAHNFVNLY